MKKVQGIEDGARCLPFLVDTGMKREVGLGGPDDSAEVGCLGMVSWSGSSLV